MPSIIVLDKLSPDGLALLDAAAKQGITYEVCTDQFNAYTSCCKNFKFGPIKQGPYGPYPTNTECKFTWNSGTQDFVYLPRDKPFSYDDKKDKAGTKAYLQYVVNYSIVIHSSRPL